MSPCGACERSTLSDQDRGTLLERAADFKKTVLCMTGNIYLRILFAANYFIPDYDVVFGLMTDAIGR
jgi:hypothetical protein